MKAIRLMKFGVPPALEQQDVSDPQIAAGEVRVKVRAIGVNPLEIKLSTGQMQQLMPLNLPWIPGIDFSGVVDQVGAGVQGFAAGDEVYASISGGGAYAELIAVSATALSHKPASLSFDEAAAVAGVAQAAWQALFDHGQLAAGQRVLIHGASGGVGTLAIQLAKWKGATVIATASPDNLDFIHDLGADQVVNSHDLSNLAQVEPVDLVIDAVGGEQAGALYPLLKRGGRLITLSQPPIPGRAEAQGAQASMLQTQPSGEGLRAFEKALKAGAVRPLVAQTFSLAEARSAWKRQSETTVRGKLVLTVD